MRSALPLRLENIVLAYAWAYGYHTPEGREPQSFALMEDPNQRYFWVPEFQGEILPEGYWESKKMLVEVEFRGDNPSPYFNVPADGGLSREDWSQINHAFGMLNHLEKQTDMTPFLARIVQRAHQGRSARENIYEIPRP